VGPSESMSKSKKNIVDPVKIIDNFGADSVRIFILSDSPPEKDVQWSEEGINSSYKFIQKLWALHLKIKDEIKKNHPDNLEDNLTKFTNNLIKKISNNLNNFSYNVIIANLHEVNSFLIKEINQNYKKSTLEDNYKKILIMMIPIIPHFANQCLKDLNLNDNLKWPTHDESIINEDEIKLVVQINGKKREILEIKKGLAEEKLIEIIQKNEKLSKFLENKIIKKKIYVPNKVLNIII